MRSQNPYHYDKYNPESVAYARHRYLRDTIDPDENRGRIWHVVRFVGFVVFLFVMLVCSFTVFAKAHTIHNECIDCRNENKVLSVKIEKAREELSTLHNNDNLEAAAKRYGFVMPSDPIIVNIKDQFYCPKSVAVNPE
ncbi:MAG: hypothetical protein KBT47_06490 [Armatimonadetes bacterium]|nr:hypothetical protein [Candidatus Hippobium faecium]